MARRRSRVQSTRDRWRQLGRTIPWLPAIVTILAYGLARAGSVIVRPRGSLKLANLRWVRASPNHLSERMTIGIAITDCTRATHSARDKARMPRHVLPMRPPTTFLSRFRATENRLPEPLPEGSRIRDPLSV